VTAANVTYPLKGMNNDSDIPPLLEWYKESIELFRVRGIQPASQPTMHYAERFIFCCASLGKVDSPGLCCLQQNICLLHSLVDRQDQHSLETDTACGTLVACCPPHVRICAGVCPCKV
jgi:hypothetical protein